MVKPVSSNQPNKDVLRTCEANTAGLAVGLAAPCYLVHDNVGKWTSQKAKEYAEVFKTFLPDADTFEHTKVTAEKVLEESGLRRKGIKLHFVDETKSNLEHLKDLCFKETGVKNAFGRRMGNNYFEMFKEGANAAYFPEGKECVAHSKSLYGNIYHEMGHAMNATGNIFSKALFKARAITPFGVSIVAPIALGAALFHNVDKNKPKEQKSFSEKTLDFVANHATALTAASYIPIVAEEGLASIRGLKAVKKHLSPDIYSKTAKNFAKAWGTYAAAAVAVTIGVQAGIWIADKIKNNSAHKNV